MCVGAALGADMYDSVYPTRTARFGVALVPSGVLKLKSLQYAQDLRRALAARLAPCTSPCLLLPPSSVEVEGEVHAAWGMHAGRCLHSGDASGKVAACKHENKLSVLLVCHAGPWMMSAPA